MPRFCLSSWSVGSSLGYMFWRRSHGFLSPSEAHRLLQSGHIVVNFPWDATLSGLILGLFPDT